MDNLMLKLDQLVTGIFSKWDLVSTALFIASFTSFVYFVVNSRDPDVHPFLLARQSQASQTRNEGESAKFRSHSTPHGIPLSSGLNIKDAGVSKWSNGRDGDLRDIWQRVVRGAQDKDGKETGVQGKLITVHGSEEPTEHDLADVTNQINLIGQYLKQNGADRVAIYLPNSIEYLATLFACAFFNITTILLPYDESSEEILQQLEKSKADTILAAAGSFPFDAIHKSYPALQQLIWIVDEGSKHMDWNEVPKGTGGAVNVSTWQEIVQDQEPSSEKDLPSTKSPIEKKIIAFFSGKAVEYTHANLIAGVSGQLNSIPTTLRFTPSDLFLSIDSFSSIYSLTLILAALHSNASVALSSVASHSPSLTLATRSIAPTIVIASNSTVSNFHNEIKAKLSSRLYSFVHWLEARDLTQNGVMPIASYLSGLVDELRPSIGNTPGKLRLIYTSTLAGVEKPLPATTLLDLRIYTRARIIHALTAPEVVGPVAQTGIYDYRVNDFYGGSHFGAPVTCLELSFQDKEDYKTTDSLSCGEIVVAGPAVIDGKASLGVLGIMNRDFTLSLLK